MQIDIANLVVNFMTLALVGLVGLGVKQILDRQKRHEDTLYGTGESEGLVSKVNRHEARLGDLWDMTDPGLNTRGRWTRSSDKV